MSNKYKPTWRFEFREHASYENSGDVPEIYKQLKTNASSLFYNTEYTKIFVAAMAIGYINMTRKPLNKKSFSIPTNVFTNQEKWLIISVGLAENKDIMSLQNENEILSIAEQYANGGIKYLDLDFQAGIQSDPLETFEKKLREYIE